MESSNQQNYLSVKLKKKKNAVKKRMLINLTVRWTF